MSRVVCISQATIYKADFDAERKAREDLNDVRLELNEKVQQLEARIGVMGVGARTPVPRQALEANVLRTAGAVEETAPVQHQQPFVRMGSAVEETGGAQAHAEFGFGRLDDRPRDRAVPQAIAGDLMRLEQAATGFATAAVTTAGGGGRGGALSGTPQPLISTNAWPPIDEVGVF